MCATPVESLGTVFNVTLKTIVRVVGVHVQVLRAGALVLQFDARQIQRLALRSLGAPRSRERVRLHAYVAAPRPTAHCAACDASRTRRMRCATSVETLLHKRCATAKIKSRLPNKIAQFNQQV
jgi:hypothetical protein